MKKRPLRCWLGLHKWEGAPIARHLEVLFGTPVRTGEIETCARCGRRREHLFFLSKAPRAESREEERDAQA